MSSPYILNTTVSSGVGSLVMLTVPTGIVNGDYLLGCVRSNQTGIHTIPSGWTKIVDEFIIHDYSENIDKYAGTLFYRLANSEPSDYQTNIESGKYIGSISAIRDTNGLDTHTIYHSGNGCITSIIYGTKVNYTGGLTIRVFGAESPLIGGNVVSAYEAPFNGQYHSGVSLSLHSSYLGYESTGNYSPPFSLERASGYPFSNSGDLYFYPPSIYYFGTDLHFKPTGV